MIDIYKEVVEIFDDKIESTTKYNGDIFKLTEIQIKETPLENNNHGDIIRYLEENKLNTDELQDVLLYFIQGLNKEI